MAHEDKTEDQLIAEFVQESENAHGIAGQSRALELIRRVLVATRDLEAATNSFRKSSEKASNVLIALTVVLVILTGVLIALTWRLSTGR